MKKRIFSYPLTAALVAVCMNASGQNIAARFDMSLTADGKITETVTQTQYGVASQLPAFTVDAPDGQALRFDGYSNYVKAGIPVASLSSEALTVSVTLAAETYPMMRVEDAEQTPTFATICGNLDENGKKGFAFELSSQGDVRFRYGSATGYLMTVTGSEKLKCGQWNELTAVLDKAGNAATLYLNGSSIGSGRMSRAGIVHGGTDFYIGKGSADLKSGPFLINTFCGLIDDISIYNIVEAPPTAPEGASIVPDFNYPVERYTNVSPSGDVGGALARASLWRPRFHAMPSGSWTNESHGMTYADGRYHVFFQKNANGPYMARLHWGHVSSADLCTWTEEPIALYPGESYDIKGCWSGCVYEDEGSTNILYTAVDNAKAVIAQAKATDAQVTGWQKEGIVINGRPQGLSDDFRDPYFFTANGKKYIIVGTSKNNIGACTLHELKNGTWTNDGTIFFQGGNQNQHGTFWEMPNVTPLGSGKYLFTCTPLNTGSGVRTLCWVGTIGSDGKFTPDASGMQYLELNGISRDGYGLLSPTIYQKDGKTLLLGIVPDKLPTQTNYEMGWAHNFSLPRELSIDAEGQLVQKPYSGLQALRSATSFSEQWESLNGACSLAPVSGRQIELVGEFTVESGEMGFHFLKNGDRQATLTYNAARGRVTLDLTALDRTANDGGSYNGIYAATLPKKVGVGEKLKLHVFLDGSVADIFICDTWAFSVRLFPTDVHAVEAEVFTTAPTAASVSAWTLDSKGTDGIVESGYSSFGRLGDSSFSRLGERVYNLQGRRVADSTVALRSLPHGLYIQGGRKVIK